MKEQRNRTLCLTVSLKGCDLDAVRYAAYAVSDAAYVFIEPSGRGAVKLQLTPKRPAAAKDLARRFKTELEEEKLRSAIFDSNRALREFMILKALSYEEAAAPDRGDDAGLTPEQEKELDALIAQVEGEIKKEAAAGKAGDPLGITRTWEERYGADSNRKKK